MRRLPTREPGQMVALTGMIMIAAVGMLAFVIDTGMFMMANRELQKAADAGAAAAMLDLARDPNVELNQDLAIRSAREVAERNLGIANQICTVSKPEVTSPKLIPASGATPRQTPGLYPYDLSDGTGYVWAVAVTVRCQAGYSFGRILDLLQMPISATGTSAIGSLDSVDCPIPFVIPVGTNEPITAANAWGWKTGELMVLNNGGQYVIPPRRVFVNGEWVTISATTTACLDGQPCGGAELEKWINRTVCASVEVGGNPIRNNGGNDNQAIGKIFSGFRNLFGIGGGGNQRIDCPTGPDPITAGVATSDWVLISTNSPCIVGIPVIDKPSYDGLLVNGSLSSINVVGFNAFYIVYVDRQTGGGGGKNAGDDSPNPPCYLNSGTCLAGYYLHPALDGAFGAWYSSGQPIWRPVR